MLCFIFFTYKFLRGIRYIGAIFRSCFFSSFQGFGVLKNGLLTRMDGVWLVGWIFYFIFLQETQRLLSEPGMSFYGPLLELG